MANFENVYMRPNLENVGNVPALGTMSDSPDIWISGIEPVADYQNVLASDENYMQDCKTGVTAGMTNYIYVRAKNGGNEKMTKNVSLFYAQSNAIQWPSNWKDNRIGTDVSEMNKVMLNDIMPGEVKVGDRPFVWEKTPKPDNDTHFCLIAQINDDQNSNPFPEIWSALDMAALVADNLQWGWRNIQTFDSGSIIKTSYSFNLTVPIDISDDICEFRCLVSPENLKGFQIEFSCSQTDSRGNKIALEKTEIIQDHDQILGCKCYLARGYAALITVYLYNDNKQSVPKNASFPFDIYLVTPIDELKKAGLLHLSTPETQHIEKLLLANGKDYTPETWDRKKLVRIGGYTGLFV